ncbi:hypothetical protein PVAND_010891 [Polypedilum vanderplanki]|uniref:Ribosomal protein eL8/eL30/eS12/Gadd45 domain-containing protein n=1 Tax=Polypedilum vanderplanki TaxID=319348 RepID=A0A9J6CGY7_POLVA|nr:hypothetical protein PVAND_010891 [Polypedilum vanderplanki]
MDNKKSKKPKKSYNLFDFIVIKRKDEKTQKIVNKKISSKPQKRGKVKRKKPTTIKKRIFKERERKKNKQLEEEDVTTEIENLKISDPVPGTQNQNQLHSRNFREYCDHFITPEIRNLCELVIKDLFRYQENKFQQNPVKAKANRRYVVGFKEVRKFLVVARLKLIFIAPDLERNTEVDKLVDDIKSIAQKHKIPYVFGLKRRKLGYLLLKKVSVSIMGIFDYQGHGTFENVNSLLSLVEAEKLKYQNKKNAIL